MGGKRTMDNKLSDTILENVSGGGITPPATKYEINDFVDFWNENKGFWDYGTIASITYIASKKSWSYYILTGEVYGHDVLEKDIRGLRK